jgi:hypothetical protein
MAHERTLWDQVDAGESKQSFREKLDKADAGQRKFKRLRGSGHWLTLLRVAGTIPQPFTLNDISVAVWKACPEFFGMKGYPYPDNHKVHFILYGQRGLIAKGLIRRVEQGLFRIPEDRLATVEPELPTRKPGNPDPETDYAAVRSRSATSRRELPA